MLPTAFVMMSLVVHIICNKANNINGFYGIKTDEYPKSSCSKIAHIKSTSECLKTCIITADLTLIISHDESTKTCMCCSDITGDDIINPNWKSYVPRTFPCKDGYVTYNYRGIQICLKYVSTPLTYHAAVIQCKAEGGDLFRLDSKLKHDLLTKHLAPIANGSKISLDVWIQGKKVENEWFFHDGSKMTEYLNAICQPILDDDVNKNYLQVFGSSTFYCKNMHLTRENSFLCEYYRQFTIYR